MFVTVYVTWFPIQGYISLIKTVDWSGTSVTPHSTEGLFFLHGDFVHNFSISCCATDYWRPCVFAPLCFSGFHICPGLGIKPWSCVWWMQVKLCCFFWRRVLLSAVDCSPGLFMSVAQVVLQSASVCSKRPFYRTSERRCGCCSAQTWCCVLPAGCCVHCVAAAAGGCSVDPEGRTHGGCSSAWITGIMVQTLHGVNLLTSRRSPEDMMEEVWGGGPQGQR